MLLLFALPGQGRQNGNTVRACRGIKAHSRCYGGQEIPESPDVVTYLVRSNLRWPACHGRHTKPSVVFIPFFPTGRGRIPEKFAEAGRLPVIHISVFVSLMV